MDSRGTISDAKKNLEARFRVPGAIVRQKLLEGGEVLPDYHPNVGPNFQYRDTIFEGEFAHIVESETAFPHWF